MPNLKQDPKKVLQNRVNGVLKSVDTFQNSLKNHKDTIDDAEYEKMKDFLRANIDKKFEELDELYYDNNKFEL